MAAERKATEKKPCKGETENKLSIEESFEKLDEILSEMEDEDCPLEKSFELYEKGIKLIRSCNESIDRVEKRMKIISEKETEI